MGTFGRSLAARRTPACSRHLEDASSSVGSLRPERWKGSFAYTEHASAAVSSFDIATCTDSRSTSDPKCARGCG